MSKTACALLLAVWLGALCCACGRTPAAGAAPPPAASAAPAPAPAPPVEQPLRPAPAAPAPPEPAPPRAEEPAPSDPPPGSPPTAEGPVPAAEGVPESAAPADVDLTPLSAVAAYSGIFNMVMSPEAYNGKTVRMRGRFILYEEPETGVRHLACVVADAGGCCAQGFELFLSDPDACPDPDTTVTVQGTFEASEQDGIPSGRLTAARLLDPAL